jgi:hypothetical protein
MIALVVAFLDSFMSSLNWDFGGIDSSIIKGAARV